MNREQMFCLKVGDQIERSFLGLGKFTLTRITRILASGITDNPRSPERGKAYVCLYTAFGDNSEVSGSIREGDERYFRRPVAELLDSPTKQDGKS